VVCGCGRVGFDDVDSGTTSQNPVTHLPAAAWTPGDGEGNIDDPGVFNWENSVLSPNRNGCFKNEFGFANTRVTCGVVYIGVLGARKDLSDLYAWTRMQPPNAEMDTPTPPGICVNGA